MYVAKNANRLTLWILLQYINSFSKPHEKERRKMKNSDEGIAETREELHSPTLDTKVPVITD